MLDRAAFERSVQEALEHLYDPAFLLTHPLAALLVPRGSGESPGRALHRILCEAIAELKPPPDAPSHSPSWRLYRYLSLRYVEMLTIGQVAAELGISPRQCRRDHHEAISAVSAILWERSQHLQAAPSGPSPPSTPPASADAVLEAEIGKIGSRATPTATRLDQIVEGVVATLASLAHRHAVALQVAVPYGLPLIAAERTMLRQSLLEVLLDALDRAAGGRVEISAAAEGRCVRLEVIGRPPAKGPPVRERSDAGRLAVSRRLAALQGAALETDVHGDGFLVRFTLPTVETPVALVVDDNADVVLLFQRYLGGLFDVHEATSGEQALQLARRLRPNVITLDVMMPSQDGWEVLQILKHDPATAAIPVIVCSVIRERELALSLGAAEFLAKPISAPELLAALQRCCFPP